MIDLLIDVSTVIGRFMLKPDPTTTNYIFILVGSEFSSSRGCRGRELGGIVNYCLQLTIIQCCSNFCCIVTFTHVDINCWLFLFSCSKTRQKMLVFDRPSIFP